MTVAEPFASRWKRRARTIPIMLSITVLGVFASPAIVAVAVAVDVAHRRFRLPTARVALFLLQYAINDSIEIVLAPVYWMLAGFGTKLGQPKSVHRHERLQQWSIDVLARRAEHLLGLRLDIDPASIPALTPGPVIVLCRHVNIVDSSLPALIYQRLGYRTRSVIMADLLADPGFDLFYNRTGSVFIPRDNGPEARAIVRALGERVDTTTAFVIFPEGRLFRPDRLERAVSRLALDNPGRFARLASLRHVLPLARAGCSRFSTASPQTSLSSPTPDSTVTHRSPSSPKPFPSATRSASSPGEFQSPKFPSVMPTASHGSTNNGCSSTTGSLGTERAPDRARGRRPRGPARRRSHHDLPAARR
jgi:Acyltransferase